MQRSYHERQTRKARHIEDATDIGLNCAHLEGYRTEAAANRALDRIKNFDGFRGSKQFPNYAYQCSAPCYHYHLSAQPVWQKGMLESGLSEGQWYERQFGGAGRESGWVNL